jgi:heat shock protein HslJ
MVVSSSPIFARIAIAKSPSEGTWNTVKMSGSVQKNIQINFNNDINKINVMSTKCDEYIATSFQYVGRNVIKVSKVNPLKSTTCKVERIKQINKIMAQLQKVNRIIGDYQKIKLLQGEKVLFELSNKTGESSINQSLDMGINGSYRIINQIEVGNLIDRTNNNSVVKFDYGAKSFSIKCGCNLISGSYESTQTTFKASNIMSTEMACRPEDKMTFEQSAAKNIEFTNRFAKVNNHLYLYQDEMLLMMLESID